MREWRQNTQHKAWCTSNTNHTEPVRLLLTGVRSFLGLTPGNSQVVEPHRRVPVTGLNVLVAWLQTLRASRSSSSLTVSLAVPGPSFPMDGYQGTRKHSSSTRTGENPRAIDL